MNTQAIVITEPGQVALQQVALRTPGPNDVVIQTAYTSISAGTERMLLNGQMPHPMLQLPVVPGYETVGRVIDVGDAVSAEWKDRWVYVGGALCYDGINGAWGGQAAMLFTDVSRVVPLDNLSPRLGVLLALTATALHGIDLLQPTHSDRVLVLGQGPVGQLAARLARRRDSWVAVADREDARLRYAEGDVVVNAGHNALVDAIDQPVSAIVEASGSMAALTSALPLLADGGTILLLGYYENLDLPYMPLFLKEARLLTAREWAPDDLVRSRDMIAEGTLPVESLLTHDIPAHDAAKAYDIALNDLNCLKLVLDWQTT
ncbi:MAG: zinc-binding dehydrogenase [Chloroflexi bacterium]|nr:zinc-binding dehydrogenase [Chloroflexota bacterium]